MRRVAFTLLTLTLGAACGTDPGGDVDASPVGGGLVFRFSAPDIGQTTIDDVTVTQLDLNLRNLQAVTAFTDDSRVTIDSAELQLETEPREIRFDQAPPAPYSAFKFDVDRPQDGESSWRLEGTVVIQGFTRPFHIEDELEHRLQLPLVGVEPGAGEVATIDVQVGVAAIVDGIDWESLPLDGEIDSGSSEMTGIRARFDVSFDVADVQID